MDRIKTKKLAKWLDDQMPFDKWFGGLSGKIAELSDGYVFSMSLEYAATKVPEEYHSEINQFIDGVVDGDYDKIKEVSTSRLVQIIKSPLGDKKESLIIGGIIDIIFGLMEEEKQVITLKTVGGGGPGGDPNGGG